MNYDDKVDIFCEVLNKMSDDAVKFNQLKYQYGVASRKIHELKGANALLRETNALLLDEVADLKAQLDSYSKTPRLFSDPSQESDAKGLTLLSTKPSWNFQKPFKIRYINNLSSLTPDVKRWWKFDADDIPDSWADFEWWLTEYGPFTEVINE